MKEVCYHASFLFLSNEINFNYCIAVFSSNCFSQKEDYIWLGGYDWDADIKDTILSTEGYRLDFNKKPLEVENDVGFRFGILGNNASISDKDGSLLAFTNGCVVYNRNYQIMPNGDSINAGIWFDKLWKSCAAGYPF